MELLVSIIVLVSRFRSVAGIFCSVRKVSVGSFGLVWFSRFGWKIGFG